MTETVAGDELLQIITTYEGLIGEKHAISDHMKEVMADAKGRGYDAKALRIIIRDRKRDRDALAEEEAIVEMYKNALGM